LLDKKRPNFVQISDALETNMDTIKSFKPTSPARNAAAVRVDLSTTAFDVAGSTRKGVNYLNSKKSKIILGISILIVAVLIALIVVVVKMFSPDTTSSSTLKSATNSTTNPTFSWASSKSSWGGINSEFLYALPNDQQDEIIGAAVAANLKTIR
jgi:hypothetical protein